MTSSTLPEREPRPFYIGMTQAETHSALGSLQLKELKDLYQHIPKSGQFDDNATKTPAPVAYKDLKELLINVSEKNILTTSFIADGLPLSREAEITAEICSLRGLTTAYTPYQPERSQGTLQTLWIYQSLMSQLTGFEAVNASLYDRATCLYEAIQTSLRIKNDSPKTAWIHGGVHPHDIEVLKTLQMGTDITLEIIPLGPYTGTIDMNFLEKKFQESVLPAVFAFPQINHLGNIEDVDRIVDLCSKHKILSKRATARKGRFEGRGQNSKQAADLLWPTVGGLLEIVKRAGQSLPALRMGN